jgi:hypothetical protein
MKHLLIILFVLLVGITTAQESVKIKIEDLTSDQLIQLKRQRKEAAKANLESEETTKEKVSSWVGVGKEVGQAMNSGLMAVVDASEKFSDTKVGKYTILFIGWKIIGKDLVKILLIILGVIASLIVTLYSLRRLYNRRVMVSGSKLFFWQEREYEIIEVKDYEGLEFVKVLHIIFIVVISLIIPIFVL